MKTAIVLLLAAWPAHLIAGPRSSASYSIATDVADAGGGRAASASYTHVASAAAIAGVSNVAAPAQTAKAGFAGQLFDVTGLLVNSAQPSLDEGASLQLGVWQMLDDATFLAVNPLSVAWTAPVAPIASISAEGIATAALVYQDTLAVVEGAFDGFSDTLDLTVLDVIADNFGGYAGDGLGDAWQVQFFGQPPNADAGPLLDPDGDGQNNLFEYIAGLTPTDAASHFRLRIEPVPGQPGRRNLIFSPRLVDRVYTVKAKPGLLSGAFLPLGSFSIADDGGQRTVTDLNASGATKFYTVEITRP